MKPEEQYEAWKKQRATIAVPEHFTDHVMESVRQTKQVTTYLFLQGVMATIGRSRLAQASICSVALGIWLVRIGALLTIFVPR